MQINFCAIFAFMTKIMRDVFAMIFMISAWKIKTFGQDTLLLPMQNIVAKRTVCVKIEKLKAPFTAGSLADVVETPLVFRQYGAGGLASVSLRGTAPTHTQLYWNGLALHSPLLGQSDYNLFFDGGELLFGGASLEYGVGGFGGGILWNDEMPNDNHYRAFLSGGSFGTWANQTHMALKHKQFGARINVGYRYADNDFGYRNTSLFGQPRQTQHSAKAWFASLKPVVFHRFRQRHELCFGAWNQWAFRQIPPPQTVAYNEESQDDKIQRYTLRWTYNGNKLQTEAAAGYFSDYLYYENRLARLFAPNHSELWQGLLNASFQTPSQWSLKSGINIIRASGNASVFENRKYQLRFGHFFSLQKTIKRWTFDGLARYDYQSNFMISGRLGAEWQRNIGSFSLRNYANFGRNNRPPTLNDLYWTPGGNPDLRSESGYFSEIGTTAVLSNFELSLTAFVIHIDRWIQWHPLTATLWSPQNLKTVSGSGIESAFSYRYRVKEIDIRYSIRFLWNRATSTKPAFVGDGSVGKQMIYLPQISGWSVLNFEGKLWTFGLELTGASRRYTAADHSEFLPAYILLNAFAGLKFGNISVRLRGQNLTDAAYSLLPNRPMPGFHFFFELGYELSR